MVSVRIAGAWSVGSSGAGGGGTAAGSGGGRFGGSPAAGVSGGQALRSSDLLAQLRQRAAAAAAAGLASTDGDQHHASQVTTSSFIVRLHQHTRSFSSKVSWSPLLIKASRHGAFPALRAGSSGGGGGDHCVAVHLMRLPCRVLKMYDRIPLLSITLAFFRHALLVVGEPRGHTLQPHADFMHWVQVREAKALTQQICDFLEAAGGSAATALLIQHFEGDVPADKMALFRQLLKQVARKSRLRAPLPTSFPYMPTCGSASPPCTVLLHASAQLRLQTFINIAAVT